MLGRVFWVFCRAWLFGVVLGLVLGGGFGTFFIPVVGTIYGGIIGVVIGAIAGLGAGLLVAPAVLLRPSVLADRAWPGVVAAATAYLLITEVVFSGSNLWAPGDVPFLLALVVGAGALGAGFGAAVVRRVRIRVLGTPLVAVVGSGVGAVVAVGRVLAEEGLAEPGMLVGFTLGGGVAGGILGAVLIAFNMLVTKEPAAE